MKTSLKLYENDFYFWLKTLIISVLLLGIFFRCVNLDLKVYWLDETYTSLWISGNSKKELIQPTFGNRLVTVKELQKYQQTNQENNLFDTLERLAVEDPQHPPIFYLIGNIWMRYFGNSIAAIRGLSVVFSLLAIPCLYWLCWELFGSPLVGAMANSLMAISPFHVLFAQEAREYSLWTVTMLLSSILFLRATRLKTRSSWIFYGISLTIGFYSYLLNLLVAFSHGVYLLIIEKLKTTRNVINYLITSFIAGLIFLPWAIIIRDFDAANWTAKKLSLSLLTKSWFLSLGRLFIDTHQDGGLIKFTDFDVLTDIIRLPIIFFLISLTIYSFIFLIKNNSRTTWLFIIILSSINIVFMVLPDLILGGQRSSVTRYLTPLFLGIELAIAYVLGTQITKLEILAKSRLFWQIIAVILLSFGIISCMISSEAEVWWHKSPSGSQHIPLISKILNQSDRPLLITQRNPFNLLTLINRLKPTVSIQFINGVDLPEIPETFSDIFIYDSSPELIDNLKTNSNYAIENNSTGQEKILRLENKND